MSSNAGTPPSRRPNYSALAEELAALRLGCQGGLDQLALIRRRLRRLPAAGQAASDAEGECRDSPAEVLARLVKGTPRVGGVDIAGEGAHPVVLVELSRQPKPAVVCMVCLRELEPGTMPPSHGLCAGCLPGFLGGER